ncbi:MAG: DUF1284 domain-containing protein [Nitrospirota bacterium]
MNSSSGKIIRLRGHHLICLHFFSGEGYNAEFIANLRALLDHAKSGIEIHVSPGADDVCRACPSLRNEACFHEADAESLIREMDATALRLMGLSCQSRITWQETEKMLPEILRHWAGKYCMECSWKRICERNRKFSLMLHPEQS